MNLSGALALGAYSGGLSTPVETLTVGAGRNLDTYEVCEAITSLPLPFRR